MLRGQFQLAPVASLQGTAEPSSQEGEAAEKVYFKKGKMPPGGVRDDKKRCERNSNMNIKVREEGDGEGASGTRAEIPLVPMEKGVVEEISMLQP